MRGEAVDARADLWALGVVAYELLTGVNPYLDKSLLTTARRIFQFMPPRLDTMAPVPASFADLVARLLERDPAARMQTADEAAAVLDAIRRTASSVRPTST